MKEFDLEEFKKNPSQKVVTRDGRDVRIICTDFKNSSYPIITLIRKNKDEEVLMYYQKSGKDTYHSNLDLCFPTTKKEGWINIFKIGKIYQCGNIHNTEEEALNCKSNQNYITTLKIEWEE